MAEGIGIASGLVTIVGFAFRSSQLLYQTINSFHSSKRAVRELKQELEALTAVLASLQDAATSTDTTFAALKLPLLRCGNACKDFDAVIAKCTSHSEQDRRSFRDWAKLQYMGDDIDGFKTMLASYKSTISIAVGDANLRTAVVTTKVLKEYKEMISNTKSDLEERLEAIDAKLKSLSSQKNKSSGEERNDRNRILEERDSTTQCLDICARVSLHIDQVRPNVLRDISTASGSSQGPVTTLDGLIAARFTTDEALSKCKTTLKDASVRLEKRLQDLDSHLQTLQSDHGAGNEGQEAELQRIQDEYDTTKQSLAICTEASERTRESRVNDFEDVSMAEDGNQVIVSTIGDLISAKRINAGARSTQWLGQMSDESLQELTRAVSYVSLARASGDGPEAVKAFEARYGAGIKLKAGDSATGGAMAR